MILAAPSWRGRFEPFGGRTSVAPPYRGRGLGQYKLDSSGNPVNCDDWSNLFTLVCWNPLAQQVAAPLSSNYGAASNPTAAMAAMTPDQLAQWNANQGVIAAEQAAEAAGGAPAGTPGACTTTIITSPIAVCDYVVYIGLAVGAWFLFGMVRR